jgi:hypothetical protein
MKSRLPADGVVVDRRALTAALARTRWWEHGGSGDGPEEWTGGELADAILVELREAS